MNESTVVDPVCDMRLAPADAAATVERHGRTYHFCSDACRDTFTADPASHAATTAGHDTTNPSTVGESHPHDPTDEHRANPWQTPTVTWSTASTASVA